MCACACVLACVPTSILARVPPCTHTHNIPHTVDLRHRLLLRDSHASLLRDPAFVTNKTDSFQGVIDYIWFTPAAFRLSRILDPRPNVEFGAKFAFGGVLPSPVAPSDHVLIAAEFDMVGR